MKPDIHPKYHPEARITCACGNVIVVGATVPDMTTEVCARCHPFFTGEQRIVDTAGQVERFMRRLEQGESQRVAERTRAEELREQRLAERRRRRGLAPLPAGGRPTKAGGGQAAAADESGAPSSERTEALSAEAPSPGVGEAMPAEARSGGAGEAMPAETDQAPTRQAGGAASVKGAAASAARTRRASARTSGEAAAGKAPRVPSRRPRKASAEESPED